MDKKSFLRGFGVGVLFAAIILGISYTVRTSDSYVSSRAKELGMVYEKDTDSDLKLANKETSTASPDVTATPKADKKNQTAEATAVPKATVLPAVSPDTEQTAAPQATKKASTKKDSTSDTKKKMEAEKKKLEEEIRQEEKTLTINAGDWSSDVSKKLEELGIVKSASDFDKYLNDNGYGSSINAGNYKVSVDDTYAELARKITGK